VAGYPPGVAAAIGRQHPLQRVGQPADVAGVIEFLLGDAARFITGAVLPVDGGISARLSAMVSDWSPVDPAA
jgi:NAD(P)-dependent dehydrogenase (short-subunit alcohol dehydrogenase family)